MPRNKIILKRKNEKTLKKKCKSKKKRSFRNKKKLRGGNVPDTIVDLLRKVEEADIQEKITLLKQFLDDKLIPERDEIKQQIIALLKNDNYSENSLEHRKSVIQLISNLSEKLSQVIEIAKTIFRSLSNEDPNNDNKRKIYEVLEIVEGSRERLEELTGFLTNIPEEQHTEIPPNNLEERITNIFSRIIPIQSKTPRNFKSGDIE